MTRNTAPRQPAKTHTGKGLRTPGLLGKWPLIGLVMVLVGSSLFGVFAVNLRTNGPLIQTDMQVANNLHLSALQSPRYVLDAMIFGFFVGEQAIGVLGVLLALYFLYKRYWLELSMVLIALGGEIPIWEILSQYFHRARPTFAVSVWRQMTVPGFPSGHSFSAVLCYGLLAYLLVPRLRSRAGKLVVIAAALFIIAYVGFSRLYVGDHYLTDVLAGYALGIAYGGLVYTSAELIARRRKNRETVLNREQTPRRAEGK